MSDRFANGNPDNDTDKSLNEKGDRSNPNGRHGGDIAGMINHLDYIKELGATALWPTPLCEDNDKQGSYHTYGNLMYTNRPKIWNKRRIPPIIIRIAQTQHEINNGLCNKSLGCRALDDERFTYI